MTQSIIRVTFQIVGFYMMIVNDKNDLTNSVEAA